MVMDKVFHTSDTALAAYLAISGIELQRLNTDSNPAEYIFKDPSDGIIGNLLIQWEQGRIDCARFYRTYKQFVNQIKGSRNG